MSSKISIEDVVTLIQQQITENSQIVKENQSLKTVIANLKKEIKGLEKQETDLQTENTELEKSVRGLVCHLTQKQLLSNVWKNLLAEKKNKAMKEQEALKNLISNIRGNSTKFCDIVMASVPDVSKLGYYPPLNDGHFSNLDDSSKLLD